jgi:hypothetical protein
MMMRKRQALVTFCCNLSFCAFFPSEVPQKKTHTKNTKAFTIE